MARTTAKTRGGTGTKKVLDAIELAVRRARTLKVGFLSGAKYPDGTPVAMIAAIHNYGAPAANIPPRPFFSNLVRDHKAEWPGKIARLLKRNRYDADLTLNQAGEQIRGELEEAIRRFEGVPLKEATVKRKGFSKQLIDSGYLVDHTGFEVE